MVLEVLEQKRTRQYDIDRETAIMYETLTNMKNHKLIYSLIDDYVPYFT